MSKGDWKRPPSISREEEDKRYEDAFGVKPIKNWDPSTEEDAVKCSKCGRVCFRGETAKGTICVDCLPGEKV